MPGRSPKQKGYRRENELRKRFEAAGIACRRIPLSGGGSNAHEKFDLELLVDNRIAKAFDLKVEVKSPKSAQRTIHRWLDNADVLIVQNDREEPLVTMRLPLFVILVGGRENEGARHG